MDEQEQTMTDEQQQRAELGRDLRFACYRLGMRYLNPDVARRILDATPNLRATLDRGDLDAVRALLVEHEYFTAWELVDAGMKPWRPRFKWTKG